MIKSFLRDGDQLMEQLTDFCPTTQGDEVVKNSVSEILHDVHKNGDEAVLSRTLLYDKAKLASGEIRVTQDELKKAGLDTAKSVLEQDVEDLIKRTDLEEETILEIRKVLTAEFSD